MLPLESFDFRINVPVKMRDSTILYANIYLPQRLDDAPVLKMAKKVRHVVDPSFGVLFPVRAEIKTAGGKKYSYQVEKVPDKAGVQANIEPLVAKFKDCASYSKKHLSKAKIQKLANLVLHLEKVSDMREIGDLLA